MQLTRFDRWLREKFVYRTHIYTMRPPERLPRGVKRLRFPATESGRYQCLYLAKNPRAERAFITELNAGGQLFTTRIVESKSMLARIVAPEGKSLTWSLISTFFLLTALAAIAFLVYRLWQNPEIQKNLLDAIEVLKQ
ncbi:MAG: hypothetical protein QM627_07240 [Luteolibacter sp.]